MTKPTGYALVGHVDPCVKVFKGILDSTIGNDSPLKCAYENGFNPSDFTNERCCPRELIAYSWNLASTVPICQRVQSSSHDPWKLSDVCSSHDNQAVLSNNAQKFCYVGSSLKPC